MLARRYTGGVCVQYRRSDERIQEQVCDALTQHSEVDATDIEVQVRDGEVTLTGTVADRWQKYWAEDTAAIQSGVNDVQNLLRVQRPAQQAMTGPGRAGRSRRAPARTR